MTEHGIHHVTAIAGDARRNRDFYTGTLGLRLVKKTVNFDDPGTYHLYFGDETGRPGTILTFFPWAHVAQGRAGIGQAQETAFRVPKESIGFWTHRFVAKGVPHEAPEKRFGETVLPFRDPDGMKLALVGVAGAEGESAWSDGAVPAEHAIRGFAGVTLMLDDAERTGVILSGVLGFREAAREGALVRYRADAALGGTLDIRVAKGFLPGRRLGPPHRVQGRGRRRAGGDGGAPRRGSPHPPDRAARPQLLPLDLLPRARRRPVRDRDRRPRLCRRRAGRRARAKPQATALPRAAAPRDRGGVAGARVAAPQRHPGSRAAAIRDLHPPSRRLMDPGSPLRCGRDDSVG